MLDDRQKELVRQWAAEGAGLSEVQRRIKDEFGVSMTYMDVRFLMLDLHADVKDKPEPKPADQGSEVRGQGSGNDLPTAEQDDGTGDNRQTVKPSNGQTDADDESEEDGYTPPGMDGGNVTVELDRVVRAGAIASGSVTFSDGVTGNWYVDQMGRLGITKVSKPGYQPSRADIEAFQMELQSTLAGGAY